MMHRLILSVLALSLTLVLPACDSGGEDDRTRITGTYSGTFTQDGTDYTVTVTLQQTADTPISGNNVEGDGTVSSANESVTFTTSGTFSAPSLSLDLTYDAGRPGLLTGTANDALDTIRDVHLTGSALGLNSPRFTLTR